MAELKFIKPEIQEKTSACCGPAQGTLQAPDEASCKTCLPVREKDRPAWITGTLMTAEGAIPIVSTDLTVSDYLGTRKVQDQRIQKQLYR